MSMSVAIVTQQCIKVHLCVKRVDALHEHKEMTEDEYWMMKAELAYDKI